MWKYLRTFDCFWCWKRKLKLIVNYTSRRVLCAVPENLFLNYKFRFTHFMPAGVLLSLIIFAKPTQQGGFFVLSIVEIFQFAYYFEYFLDKLLVERHPRTVGFLSFTEKLVKYARYSFGDFFRSNVYATWHRSYTMYSSVRHATVSEKVSHRSFCVVKCSPLSWSWPFFRGLSCHFVTSLSGCVECWLNHISASQLYCSSNVAHMTGYAYNSQNVWLWDKRENFSIIIMCECRAFSAMTRLIRFPLSFWKWISLMSFVI